MIKDVTPMRIRAKYKPMSAKWLSWPSKVESFYLTNNWFLKLIFGEKIKNKSDPNSYSIYLSLETHLML